MDTQNGKSLYEKLGKYEGIAALADDIVAAHFVNPVIKDSFLPYKNSEELITLKNHLIDFMCAGTGGPEEYTGRDMPSAHKDMNITEDEYDAAVQDIMNCLKKHGRDEGVRKEVHAITDVLKEQIVGQ